VALEDLEVEEPTTKTFTPSEHPRAPAGTAQGGEFLPKVVDRLRQTSPDSVQLGAAGYGEVVPGDVMKGFVASLGPEERWALKMYTSSNYREINPWMRAGRPADYPQGVMDVSELKANTTILERMFTTHAVATNREVVAFRGLKLKPGQELRPGTVLEDKAFISTTLDPNVARDFAEPLTFKHPIAPTVMALKIPRGTPVIPTQFADGGVTLVEHELILPPGTKVRITQIEHAQGKPGHTWTIAHAVLA
jgi:hypothetical protein